MHQMMPAPYHTASATARLPTSLLLLSIHLQKNNMMNSFIHHIIIV